MDINFGIAQASEFHGHAAERYPRTPDGRYFVVQGRLWRTSKPALAPAQRERLVRDLMAARRAVRASKGDPVGLAAARAQVDAAKRVLGELGPVWWTDDSPDYNRHMAANTPYAAWFVSLGEEQA
jgi:hypothetical protein